MQEEAAAKPKSEIQIDGIFWSILSTIVVGGVAMSVLWLWIIRSYPRGVIWFSFGTILVVSATLSIVLFIIGQIIPGVFMLILFIVAGVLIFLVQQRIKFAAVMLELVVKFIEVFPAVVYLALICVVVQAVWLVLWVLCAISVVYAVRKADNNPEASGGFIFFLLLITFFWTSQMVKNIVHITTAGTLATWYFYADEEIPPNPTVRSFRRAMTTSFGSIAVGSLVIAIIRAIKIIILDQMQSCGLFCQCCMICIMDCIDSIVSYFNMYAFTRIAIYGVSYCDAAVGTWQMLKARFLVTIINDDLVGIVLLVGALFGGAVVGVISAVVSYSMSHSTNLVWIWALIGFLMGFAMIICATEVVESGVSALYVCYADDPEVLARNRPYVYNELTRAFNEVRDRVDPDPAHR
jgi:hypothetical protein